MAFSCAQRIALAASLFGASFGSLRVPIAQRIERSVADSIRGLRRPSADPLIGIATDLGSVYGIAGISLALAATGRRETAVEVGLAGALAWGLAQGAKPLAKRPRPFESGETERLVAVPAGTSWPSGHAAVATAMGLAIGAQGGPMARGLGRALSGFVGLSRVYVGVHHPTDILAGASVGVVAHLTTSQAITTARRFRRTATCDR
ncbi:MAG: membrane-associated phospholipid phosphatase [Glaciecola sp.]|jgi:membrane-associated phospholipid phosphatase